MAEHKIQGIYCVRNVVSGRVYVGSGLNIKHRWIHHRSLLSKGKHHSPSWQRSWNKHGPDAFTFEIVELVPSRKDLVIREQFWIDEFNAACPRRGFNVLPLAGSPLGFKASDETRAKQSAARRGRKFGPMSEEHKAKISAAQKGKPRSYACFPWQREDRNAKTPKDVVERVSSKRRGMPLGPMSDEHKAKIAAATLGVKKPKQTAESNAKRSAKLRGRPNPSVSIATRARNLARGYAARNPSGQGAFKF